MGIIISAYRIAYLCACLVHFGSDMCQILNDFFGVFRFSSARLARTQYRLIFALSQHGPIRLVRNSEHVRRHLVTLLALVQFDNFFGVNGQHLVRIEDDTKQARVCL